MIVEGTAGNTGIGLALVGNTRGYRTVIVIPETQSQEKMDMLRLVGADLRPVPAVPYKDPNNYVKLSGRLAEELARTEPNGAIWANQFDNVANRMGHYRTTGPEIWAQTGGRLDAFTCAVGTGGTLAGVGLYLKERKPAVRIVLGRPDGSGTLQLVQARRAEGRRLVDQRGHRPGADHRQSRGRAGRRRVPDHRRGGPALHLRPDRRRGAGAGQLLGDQHRGCGARSPGMGPGHTIVTILCDYGTRYQSKLFNPEFLREKDLPVPAWLA